MNFMMMIFTDVLQQIYFKLVLGLAYSLLLILNLQIVQINYPIPKVFGTSYEKC